MRGSKWFSLRFKKGSNSPTSFGINFPRPSSPGGKLPSGTTNTSGWEGRWIDHILGSNSDWAWSLQDLGFLPQCTHYDFCQLLRIWHMEQQNPELVHDGISKLLHSKFYSSSILPYGLLHLYQPHAATAKASRFIKVFVAKTHPHGAHQLIFPLRNLAMTSE